MLLLLATITLLVLQASSEDCPLQEDLGPCTCFKNIQISVYCKGGSLEGVKSAIEHLRGKFVLNLEFQEVKLGKLPASFFKGVRVGSLHFRDCQMTDLVDAQDGLAFDGLQTSLQNLHLNNSIQGEMKAPALSHLRWLRVFKITKFAIPVLNADWLSGMPVTLRELWLEDNDIEFIGYKAMVHLVNLSWVNLKRQNITSFRRDILPKKANKLRAIALVDCQLTSLPEDLFMEMPALKTVYISGNQIRRLSSYTWSSKWSELDAVYAADNPIECDEHIEWMFKVKRPGTLRAKCVGPPSRSGKELKEVIDTNRQ